MDVTTVADDLVVLHDGTQIIRHEGLDPDRSYRFDGSDGSVEVRTLRRPGGELLCRFATVNDVHFGELECGKIDDNTQGPIQRAAPGTDPYPEVMNRAAVAEIAAIDPDAVFVKGDLSSDGLGEEWDAFEACYRGAFGSRLHVVRGNHDAYRGQDAYSGDQSIELAGASVALLDTVRPTMTTGRFDVDQAGWLSDVASDAAQRGSVVITMGHHQNWTGGKRTEDYFGIRPEDSERLTEVIAAQRAIVAYTAGHTHRHRVRRVEASGDVPYVEIGCVKDFPGTWAEYRVYEGGIMQIVHRIGSEAALAWSESCRHLYADFGIDYESYALGRLEDRCFVIDVAR